MFLVFATGAQAQNADTDASAASPPNTVTFHLVPNPAFVNCLADSSGKPPKATVVIVRGRRNDNLTLTFRNVKPGLAFDLFTVQHSPFLANGSPDPDFAKFAVTDYGQTVRLGDYEASADAILYEFDEDYRIRVKKRSLENDQSIGGSIRRLRLQKGLRQSDFPGITSKEIARIERGKVKKPHRETLQRIADRTGVPVDQIQSY